MANESGFDLSTRREIAKLRSDDVQIAPVVKKGNDYLVALPKIQKAHVEEHAPLDVQDHLTLELLRRLGVIGRATDSERTSLRTLRAEFDAIDPSERGDYHSFLGSRALREVELMTEEVKDFHDSYAYAVPLGELANFSGFIINSSISAPDESLPNTG